MIDIVLTMNTAFYREGKKIVKRKKIILNYLAFWFWLDLISSLPYGLIFDSYDINNPTFT